MRATAAPSERITVGPTGEPSPRDFDAFVVASSARLLRTAYLMTRDAALAEDLLQTALVKAWSAWDRLDGPPEPYVRRIVATTYATWWRRRWHGELASDEVPEPPPGPAAVPDDRHDLWVALGRLPRRQRAVIVLRYFDDLTEAAIAEALGCSVGTVKSQTSKAMAHLRVDPALARSPEENR